MPKLLGPRSSPSMSDRSGRPLRYTESCYATVLSFSSRPLTVASRRSTEGVMYLPEDDADVFDLMVGYIYPDRIPSFSAAKYNQDDNGVSKFSHGLYTLFALAEKLCMNDLANRLMDEIQDFQYEHSRVPSMTWFCDIYNMTSLRSKLRCYAVLMCLREEYTRGYATLCPEDVCPEGDVKDDKEVFESLLDTHPEFAKDYIALNWKFTGRFNSETIPDARIRNDSEGFGRCFFHTHSNGEECHLGHLPKATEQ
ncbi:hypothetical protein ONS95_008172 [Cadophora gregata]|uniref:uncharacterized protein n=1 Tax=Cadophora gregata TaxID=51156 RepID=UPI0026DCCD45|nr:uncharacterized protein ONS95_008172 [Cadophora gregata]KAK0119330.1 hypothetical protein ONS96_012383 [Cadophora gregata f. sp. sojae]KAK0126584.1 hypothetical protein ONS95_008172 [Cadophora gregata]